MTTMRERLVARFGDSKSFNHIFADEAVMNFAEAEASRAVAEALQPRDPSPELAEAERWLRLIASYGGSTKNADGGPDCPTSADAWRFSPAIVDELTRLRVEFARLQAAPSRTVYTPAFSEEGACAAVAGHGYFVERPLKKHTAMLAPGQEWYEVTFRAAKVWP